MTAYATKSQIIDAISRANLKQTFDEQGYEHWTASEHDMCGTYHIIPTWVGNQRVFMAERIEEREGYEVAYSASQEGSDLNIIEEGERWGFWANEQHIHFLDRTVHLKGVRAGVALDMGRLYNQEAVYDWANDAVIDCTEAATALPA